MLLLFCSGPCRRAPLLLRFDSVEIAYQITLSAGSDHTSRPACQPRYCLSTMLNASQARCLIFTLVVINAMYAPGASALSKAAAPAPHHQHRRAGDLSHGSNQMRRARRSTSSHQQRDGVALLAASAVPSATPVIQVPAAAISGSAAHTTNTTCPVGLHKGLLSNKQVHCAHDCPRHVV